MSQEVSIGVVGLVRRCAHPAGFPRWVCAIVYGVVLSAAVLPNPSVSADPRGARRSGGASFERYVPGSTEWYITASKPGEVEKGLRRAHAGRLWTALTGTSEGGDEPLDLRAALARFLGPKTSIDVDDLMNSEVGIAAHSWSGMSRGVLLVRVTDADAVQVWFPQLQHRRRNVARPARIFRTRDRLIVGVRDDILVMGHHWKGDPLLIRTLELLRGRKGETLEAAASYQQLKAHLPPRSLVQAFVTAPYANPENAPSDPRFWPAIGRAVIGLYEHDGRLELAVRGSLRAPAPAQGRLPTSTVERLLSLPRTTLLAGATTFDLNYLFETAKKSSPTGLLSRFLTLLSGLQGAGSVRADPLPVLGPSFLVAWGQDLSGDGGTPQLAVLVQCSQAFQLRNEVTRIAGRIIKRISSIDADAAGAALKIEHTRHLGVRVTSIPLKDFVSRSRLPMARLFASLEPSWAASGDWLILALGREHLERLLDARFGLVPTLETLDDARGLRRPHLSQTGVMLFQGGLAADVIRRWLDDDRAGNASLLSAVWWERLVGSDFEHRLGLAIREEARRGAVVVERVTARGPADGRLQPGDRIIGIDGRLLALSSPASDLRERWASLMARSTPTLRVLRNEEALDVVLPTRASDDKLALLRLEPAAALDELVSLIHVVQSATFAVYASEEQRYSARLTLRMTPDEKRDGS